ncbi:MAG TPA: hypothetical protein VMG12_09295 [Polyangiaceae bacterium]|nr:hypothetical protein [Polyangiaceae bacterium]
MAEPPALVAEEPPTPVFVPLEDALEAPPVPDGSRRAGGALPSLELDGVDALGATPDGAPSSTAPTSAAPAGAGTEPSNIGTALPASDSSPPAQATISIAAGQYAPRTPNRLRRTLA